MFNGELRLSTCFTEIISMTFNVGPHYKLSVEFYFDSLPSIKNSNWYEIKVRFKKKYIKNLEVFKVISYIIYQIPMLELPRSGQ